MSKKPMIDHEYHAHKDKLKVTVKGYALSKKARDQILKWLIADVQSKPDRLTAVAKKIAKKKSSQKLPGHQKISKQFVEVGD